MLWMIEAVVRQVESAVNQFETFVGTFMHAFIVSTNDKAPRVSHDCFSSFFTAGLPLGGAKLHGRFWQAMMANEPWC